MVITLMGTVLALTGWHVMRIAWFPIAFLVCGIPWPGLIYSRVAGPLQQLAANVAVWTLQLTGVEASVGGTKISMVSHDGSWRTLNVAEACAGMRSLMTFISVAAAVAFLSSRPLWQKIIVVLFAIPIAIFCNVMRVSGQGLLDRYVSHQLSENFAHQFVGLIMLIPAFLLILLVGWVLDQIFVEQIDRRHVRMAPKILSRSLAVASAPPTALPASAVPRSMATARETTKAASIKAAKPSGNVAASDRPAPPVAEAPAIAATASPTTPPRPVAPSLPKTPTPARTASPSQRTTPAPARTTPPPARAGPPPVRTAPVPVGTSPKPSPVPRPPATPYKPGTPPPPTVRLAWRRPPSQRHGDNGDSSSPPESK
jgi:exosortase